MWCRARSRVATGDDILDRFDDNLATGKWNPVRLTETSCNEHFRFAVGCAGGQHTLPGTARLAQVLGDELLHLITWGQGVRGLRRGLAFQRPVIYQHEGTTGL